MSDNFGPRPGGNASSLDVSGSTVVKAAPGTLYAINVATAGSTAGYAADATVVPANPVLSEVVSGALDATTYYVQIAYTDSTHAVIGTLSAEVSLSVALNNVLVVASPAAHEGAAGWIPYVAASAGAETNQVATPVAIGTHWQEPDAGLISGTTAAAAVAVTQICAIPNTVGNIDLVWPLLAGLIIVPGTSQVLSVSFQ